MPFSGGSSPWAHTGQIADNMLEDEKHPEEEDSQPEEQRKIEDNLVDNDEGAASSNHLLEEPRSVIDSGNTIENQESVHVGEREEEEEDDTMKKASVTSEVRDNVGSGESVKQNLGTT